MRKNCFALILLLILSSALFAAFNPEYSDYLFYTLEDYEADEKYLAQALSSAESNSEKSSILWRQSRNILTQGDGLDENDKEGRFSKYEEAEALAIKSIELEPNADAYHWKSSAVGRWGQTKGPLNSLSKAPAMLEDVKMVVDTFGYDYTDAWYVLGLLYNQLPGWPISFGDTNAAISYMRKSLDTRIIGRGLFLTLYQELSDQLYDRNWDAKKRAKEFDKMKKSYDKESIPSEKMKYYEGSEGSSKVPFYSTVPLSKMSDRQEAVMLLRYAEALYKAKENPLESETEKYNEIVARLGEIT